MKIEKVWFSDDKIFICTDTGQEFWQSLLWSTRLRYATLEQRLQYKIDDEGIRWESIDEDISLESFFYNNPEPVGISKVFLQHPELNASAFARRMGMQQSLLAAYINGTKKPSKECTKEIETSLHNFAQELQQVQISV